VVFASILCFIPAAAFAEIIIDDFDDAVEVDLPEMEEQQILTTRVGALNADRRVIVRASQTDPIGLLDVNVTRESHLTTRIDGQFLSHPDNTPLLSFATGYEFADPVDLTQGGLNDTVFVDMRLFQGPGIPGELSLSLLEGNNAFLAILPRFGLLSDTPYTVAVPFSSFGFRGGGGGSANFSTVSLIGVTVRLLTGNRDPNTKWLVQIDRIRVGQLVPEPSAGFLMLVAALFIGNAGSQRQRTSGTITEDYYESSNRTHVVDGDLVEFDRFNQSINRCHCGNQSEYSEYNSR
jgi:hypothetical protein